MKYNIIVSSVVNNESIYSNEVFFLYPLTNISTTLITVITEINEVIYNVLSVVNDKSMYSIVVLLLYPPTNISTT